MILEWKFITEEVAQADIMQKKELTPEVPVEQTVTENKAENQSTVVRVTAPVPDKNGENRKEIKLLCQNSAKKKIQRAFGTEVSCKVKSEDTFTVTVETVVDKAFFGWLASMGRNVHILKPKKAAVAYRDYLKNIAKDYKGIDK